MSWSITDTKKLWRVTAGAIENRQTGEVRFLALPSNAYLSAISENAFIKECKKAFETGSWE